MPRAAKKPASTGLNEFDAETTSNPGPEEQARRERVAAASESGDLVETQKQRYGADRASAAGSWFLELDDQQETLRMVWYGAEGTTKTTSLATAANHGRILIIDAETGVKKRALQKRGIDTSNIRYWPNHQAGEKLTKKGLREVFERLQADLIEDPNSWYAVGFDSFTEITRVMVMGAQGRRVNQALRMEKKIDREFIDRADYGQAAKWLGDLIREYRTLPCHILVTALMRRDVDDDTGKVVYGPATSPAVQNDLAAMMDIVIMCKGEDTEGPIRGLTKATGRYRAKDRFDAAPRVLVEPTFARYLAYYEGELTEDTDPEQKRYGKAGKPVDKELSTADELDELDGEGA